MFKNIAAQKLFLLLALSFCFISCTSIFYQPTRKQYFIPQEGREPFPLQIEFESGDKTKLVGWFFKHKPPLPFKGLILQFHGNAENMSSHFSSVAWLLNEGYDLFTFDYRGYGISEGTANPKGVFLDSLAAIEKAIDLAETKNSSIILYGQSLGTAIALRALEELKDLTPIRAVVLESGFYSYKSIATEKLSEHWVSWPFQWLGYVLVTNKYGPNQKKRPSIPYLVVHGTHDPIVPFNHGQQIFKALPEPKTFWAIDSNRHIGLMNEEQGKLRPKMLEFLERGTLP